MRPRRMRRQVERDLRKGQGTLAAGFGCPRKLLNSNEVGVRGIGNMCRGYLVRCGKSDGSNFEAAISSCQGVIGERALASALQDHDIPL